MPARGARQPPAPVSVATPSSRGRLVTCGKTHGASAGRPSPWQRAGGRRAWDPGASPFPGGRGGAGGPTRSGLRAPPGFTHPRPAQGSKCPSAAGPRRWTTETPLTDRTMEGRTRRPREAKERRPKATWEGSASGDGSRGALRRRTGCTHYPPPTPSKGDLASSPEINCTHAQEEG